MMITILTKAATWLLPAAYQRFAPLIGKAFIGLLIAAILAATYWHYTGLVEDKAALSREVGQLETDLAMERGNVTTLQASRKEWVRSAAASQAQAEATKKLEAEARAQLDRLNDIFAKHDLYRLALRKPGLIERRANDGTDRVFAAIECASGRIESCPDPEPTAQTNSTQASTGENEPGSLASDNP